MAEEKKETCESPNKPSENGSEETSSPPVNGEVKNSVPEAKENGAVHVNGVTEGAAGKETMTEKKAEERSDKVTGEQPQDGKDEEKEEPEGSGSDYRTLLVWLASAHV